MTPEELLEQLARDMPMHGVPEKAQRRVWELAWEMGHPGGADEVATYYDDFRALALLAAGVRGE